MSLIRVLTEATKARINAAPNHAAPAVPIDDKVLLVATPNNGIPKIKIATPRLAPELIPNT